MCLEIVFELIFVCVTVCMYLGKKLGFTIDLGKLHNVSLGQGQESVAELAMEKASKEGHWVILQVCLCACYRYIVYFMHTPYANACVSSRTFTWWQSGWEALKSFLNVAV